MIHSAATLYSLGVTPPTLIFSGFVAYMFYNPVLEAYKAPKKTPFQYMVIGIFWGMVADFGDYFYWAFPWTSDYLDLVFTPGLFGAGVYSNSIFRQTLGGVGSLYHIKGLLELPKQQSTYDQIIFSAKTSGMLFVLVVVFLKYYIL